MTSGPQTGDRRTTTRLHAMEQHHIVSARVRPGHRAQVLDVSAGGALIETQYRLLPGTTVELHMETASSHTCIRGRVVRCSVSGLRPSAVSYCGAIEFERDLPWFVDPPRPESGAHRSGAGSYRVRPACPAGAPASPEVI